MKRILIVIICIITMVGCAKSDDALDSSMELRSRLLKSEGCEFDAVITADYGEKIYTFSMHCAFDSSGKMSFCVTDPESIAGITGTVGDEGGRLTFDDNALAFDLLADGQITPVSAPWLLIQTLRSGYIRACVRKDSGLHIIIDDSYAEDALQVDIYTDTGDVPLRGEFLWDGRRILSVDIRSFVFL